MFVSTFGAGMAMGMPDVCKTPPFAAAPSQTTKLVLRYDPSEVAFKGQFVSESPLQHRIRCWNPPAVPHFL